MKKLLTVNQVGEMLLLSRQSVQRMIDEKILPALCVRSGRRKKVWRIDEADLERWVDAQKQGAPSQAIAISGRRVQAIR